MSATKLCFNIRTILSICANFECRDVPEISMRTLFRMVDRGGALCDLQLYYESRQRMVTSTFTTPQKGKSVHGIMQTLNGKTLVVGVIE